MKAATSWGRDGLWVNFAPTTERVDWLLAITPFGWSVSIALFGREVVVGRTHKRCVVVAIEEPPEGKESLA